MSAEPHLPLRPLLRPGVRVTRIGDGMLRLGLDRHSVVLADDPDLRSLLLALHSGSVPVSWTAATTRIALRLQEAHLLVDGGQVWAALATPHGGPQREALVSSVFARAADAPERLTRRRALAVRLDVPPAWRVVLEELLVDAELGGHHQTSRPADVAVVARCGEPDRSELDAVVRVGEPHLIVSAVEGVVQVGPFVVPGSTACLRCVDAHRAERDPRRPLVVAQYARPDTERPVPEPVDPTLVRIALAIVAHDLAAWAEGEEPSTWSSTLEIAVGLRLGRHHWTRHPHCGCSWGDQLLA